MKKLLSVLLVAMLILSMVPTSVFAASEIIAIGVDDILEPIDGSKLDFSGVPAHSNKYSITKIFWSEYDSEFDEWERDMEPNDTCIKGNNYVVFVTLEAKSGYTFSNSLTATINGAKANKYQVQDNGKKIQIYYAFVCKKNIARVDLTIVNPVIGKTPTFAKVNTAEYESKNTSGVSNQANGVSWTNQKTGINITVNNPFKADGKYTVKYYLTAKENYWFNGTKYYINGKQVYAISSNAGMTEVVVGLTDLIPGDGKRVVDSLSLNITAPADGAKPSYDKIDGTGYYSDNGINGVSTRIYKNGIAWYKSASSFISPGTTETFAGGTNYILKIALTPKDGYKFADNVTAKINGKSATVERFDDGSINASVTLTATKKGHTHTASGWKNDEGYHWKVCTDSACGSLIGDKVAHTDSNKDNKCDVCGYQKAVSTPEGTTNEVTSTTQTPAEETTSKNTDSVQTPDTNENNDTDDTDDTNIPTDENSDTEDIGDTETTGAEASDQEDGGYLLWIILGAVLVLAAGSVVTFIVLKKKKEAK